MVTIVPSSGFADNEYNRDCEVSRPHDLLVPSLSHYIDSSLFNLGVTHYHLKEFDHAISAWEESIELQPSSADTHTSKYTSFGQIIPR